MQLFSGSKLLDKLIVYVYNITRHMTNTKFYLQRQTNLMRTELIAVRLLLAHRLHGNSFLDEDQLFELNNDLKELYALFDERSIKQSTEFNQTLRSVATWLNTCH